MKTGKKLWVVEAHDLGALQVREIGDAVALNKKKWLAGEKADRMLLGVGETIEEALEVERELKKCRRQNAECRKEEQNQTGWMDQNNKQEPMLRPEATQGDFAGQNRRL